MSGASVAHLKLRLGIPHKPVSRQPSPQGLPAMYGARPPRDWMGLLAFEAPVPGCGSVRHTSGHLLQSALKANGVERFQWHLPRLADLHSASAKSPETASCSLLLSLAELIEHLVQSGAFQPLLLRDLYEVYREEFRARGWVAGCRKLAHWTDRDSLPPSYCEPLRRIPEFASLAQDEEAMATQLGRLLRPPRSGTHPLRHLLLIRWLFGTAQRFDLAMKSKGVHTQSTVSKHGATRLPRH